MRLFFLLLLINAQLVAFGQKNEKYKKGYYYDLNNNKIEGLIEYKYSHKKNFHFKKDNNSKKIKVHATLCKGFVMEADSFTVIRNFNFEGANGVLHPNSIDFVLVIATGKVNLYKHFSLQGDGNPTFPGTISLENYIISKEGQPNFITIRKRNSKKFKSQIAEIIDNQRIVDKVNRGDYTWNNMPNLVNEYNSDN